MSLVSKFPPTPNSSYHAAVGNFFTSPNLLRLLKFKGIAVTGTLRANRTKDSPLSSVDEMKEQSKGTCDVVVDSKLNVTLVWWKDKKVVTVTSTVFWKKPMKKVKHFIKVRGGRVEINQPNSIALYCYLCTNNWILK